MKFQKMKFLKILLKHEEVIFRVLSISVFLIGWHITSLYYNSIFFPTPVETGHALVELLMNSETYYHLSITSLRVFLSIGIACVLGAFIVLIGEYLIYAKYFIETIIYPIFQSVPSICWVLLVIVWFGLSEISPIFVVVASILPYFIISVWEGIKELDGKLLELGRSFTNHKWIIFKKIMFPQIYPYLFSSLRASFGTAWKVILVGEIFGTANGVGFMLDLARQTLDITRVLSWTICITIIIMLSDYLFNYLDRKTMRKYKNV